MRGFRAIAVIAVLTAATFERAAAEANDEAVREKLAPIIQCINNSDFVLQRTFVQYRRLLEDIKRYGSGSMSGGGFKDGDPGLANSLKCADGLDQAVKASPKIDDLDRAASDYATAIHAFVPIATEADRYYGQNDYKDDKWAKGRDLDQKLQPLIAKLEEASDGLHAGVKRELKSLRQRQLAALEAKSGRNLRWHAENFMIVAREMLDTIEENPTVAAIAPAIERTQKAYDDAQAYASAHDSELHPAPILIPSAWASMENSAGFFLRDLKDLRRALESGKATPADLKKEYGYVVSHFNDLVTGYNNSRS